MTEGRLHLFNEFLRQGSEMRLPEDILAPDLDILVA